MRILITGANGFIGKNLTIRLGELANFEIIRFERGDAVGLLSEKMKQADAIVHLAGENRPKDVSDFAAVNAGLTETVCTAIAASGRKIPLILTSSTQAELDNPYGRSKKAAEQAVKKLAVKAGNPAVIYRLPGVFGKWCRPNYNSVVATFCYNVANGLPLQINDPQVRLRLVHVDDVINEFLSALAAMQAGLRWGIVEPEYTVTVGELAAQIEAFRCCRTNLLAERVGTGLVRALYSTYLSYFPKEKFSYELPCHSDERGMFVEMLKTYDSGQFSFFTAHPGVTRGGHYHHAKTEKFLVLKGAARFSFRHVLTGETWEIFTSGERPQVVETVPGWTHDITNIGNEEMVVMLWANEIFDREHPDTVACKV
jgi:UDP-2-acetamido-2,6-beta-L-arabino-hexul-4-ose reductase